MDAPKGAGLLLSAVICVSRILRRVAEQTQIPEIFQHCDIAHVVLEILARHPSLFDEGYGSADSATFSKRYQVFARRDADVGRWHIATLIDGLLCHILLVAGADEASDALVEAIRSPPVIPELPVQEVNAVARMRLLSSYLARHPRKDHSDTAAGLALENLLNLLVEERESPAYQPDPSNIQYLEDLNSTAIVDGHVMSAQDRMKRLVASITTRLGASIRHDHAPHVRLIPCQEDVRLIARLLSKMSAPRVDWILCHGILGSYAKAVLGHPGTEKFRYAIKSGHDGQLIRIGAPILSEGQSRSVIAGCLDVRQELLLPLPRALLDKVSRINTSEAYSYESAARLASSDMRQWGETDGLFLRLAKLARLLPGRIDDGSIDKSVQHLMGFADLTPRDSGIYYFSPQISLIESRFKNAIAVLADLLECPEILERGWTSTGEQLGCFGVSIRPSPEAIRRLVAHLKETSRLPPGKPTKASRLRAFNARAAYVTVFFLAATGARPTGDVFPRRSAFSVEEGLALLSEKDSLLYRSTRWVRFLDRVGRKIDEFCEDRREFETALRCSFDPELAVFLVDENDNPVAPSVANMKRLVPGFEELWPWADDVLRHHFRSRGWELGCPSDVLARLMGHLSKSAMPDGLFAGRRIEDAIRAADPFINTLLDELGFE